MSKLTEFVKLEDLAQVYQKIIGNRFSIRVNANFDLSDNRECGIMLATRQPYKIENIKAESIQVVLRFYTCCEDYDVYNSTIQQLGQLSGYNKGLFTSNGKEYKYNSFLDFTSPVNEPIVDTGEFCQVLEIMGTCLVTQTEGGALVGNEVETRIRVDIGKESEFEDVIEVLSANTSLTKAQEAPQMSNKKTAKVFNSSQVYSFSYSILILKNRICERLIKALRGKEPFGLNEEIQITEIWPTFTSEPMTDTKRLVLTNGNLGRNAGAFCTAELTFQEKLEI